MPVQNPHGTSQRSFVYQSVYGIPEPDPLSRSGQHFVDQVVHETLQWTRRVQGARPTHAKEQVT